MKRFLQILLAIAFCAAIALMLWYSQPRPLIGVGYVKSSRSLVGVAEIRLTGFDAGRRMVSGTVEVRFVPGRAGEQPQSPEQYAELFRALEGYDAAYLTLEDEREGGAGDGRQKAIFRSGESDDLKFDRSQGVRARGSFHFTIEAHNVWGPIAYPFDHYTARIRPQLWLKKSGDRVAYSANLEQISFDLADLNLTPVFSPGREDSVWFTMSLSRPFWLQLVAGMALGLFVLWAVRRPLSSKPTEPSELFAVFGGIFGLHASLLPGAPVAPSIIDYVSILCYLYVIASLILSRIGRTPTPKCPFCYSDVHPRAKVCSACTRDLLTTDHDH